MPAATEDERAQPGITNRPLALHAQEMMMKTIRIAAASLALALGAGLAAPVYAAEDPYTFDKVFGMADKNHDGMVTKKEFLDAMGKVYDDKMKAMKGDAKMVKGDAMTRDGLKSVIDEIYRGA
jgi:hypothetical protein